ncbi:MAG: PAS domain S-box protein [Planctomycetaceae bacterium]|nr:PAS domain S-box protein [Planctomycetaceae bacterium]
MLSSDAPRIIAASVDSETLFSGLVRQTSEGRKTVDYLSAVSAFGRCVAAGPELAVLLHDACELAQLVAQADLLMIAQLTPDARQLSLQVASFNEKRKVSVQSLDAISADPDISMAAFSMHAADVVQSENIVTESRFTDLLLRRLQMGSGIFVPLCSHNRAFGALGLARRQPGSYTREESGFAAGIAQLLASYLAQRNAEGQLQRREASMKATLDSVESLILTLDEQGVVREMNAAGIRISGFRVRELRDRPFWNTLIVPRDSDRVAGVFRQNAGPGNRAVFEADLLTKEGQHRAVQWSLCTVETAGGAAKTCVLSGVDRTELRERCLELEKFRKIAQGVTEAADQVLNEVGRERPVPAPTGAEKRSSPRREFYYYQRIAPLRNKCVPSDDEFVRVVCCDISAGGFSFLSKEPPTFQELVISLGTAPHDRKVVAKVVRVVDRDMDGEKMHQVGCQFIGRVGD